MSSHEQVNELLAGFALGSLTPDEEQRGAATSGQSACAADLAGMRDVVGALPLMLDEVEVPHPCARRSTLSRRNEVSADRRRPRCASSASRWWLPISPGPRWR